MNNQQTAMQELITELKRVEAYPMISFVIRIANDLLEKEKQQIIDAVNINIGYDNTLKLFPKDAEQYYNETYKKD
jgi:hypothetical protein